MAHNGLADILAVPADESEGICLDTLGTVGHRGIAHAAVLCPTLFSRPSVPVRPNARGQVLGLVALIIVQKERTVAKHASLVVQFAPSAVHGFAAKPFPEVVSDFFLGPDIVRQVLCQGTPVFPEIVVRVALRAPVDQSAVLAVLVLTRNDNPSVIVTGIPAGYICSMDTYGSF